MGDRHSGIGAAPGPMRLLIGRNAQVALEAASAFSSRGAVRRVGDGGQ